MAFALVTVLLTAAPALPIRTPTPFIHEMHDTEDDAELTVERTISLRSLLEVVNKHSEHFFACRMQFGTRETNKVLIIFDVAPNGTARNVGVSQEATSLATEPVVRCFAKELRTLTFPKTAKGERGIAFPFVTQKPTLPVRTPRADATSDTFQLLSIAQSHRTEIAHCAPKTPLPTRVRFNFVWDVTPDGAASNVGIEDEKLASDPIALCVAKELRTWKFPPELSPRTALSFPFAYGVLDGDYFETDCHFGNSAR